MVAMSFFSPKQLVRVDETGCKNKDCVCVFGFA